MLKRIVALMIALAIIAGGICVLHFSSNNAEAEKKSPVTKQEKETAPEEEEKSSGAADNAVEKDGKMYFKGKLFKLADQQKEISVDEALEFAMIEEVIEDEEVKMLLDAMRESDIVLMSAAELHDDETRLNGVTRANQKLAVTYKDGSYEEISDSTDEVGGITDSTFFKKAYCSEHQAIRSCCITHQPRPFSSNWEGYLSLKGEKKALLNTLVFVAREVGKEEMGTWCIRTCDCEVPVVKTTSGKKSGGGKPSGGKPSGGDNGGGDNGGTPKPPENEPEKTPPPNQGSAPENKPQQSAPANQGSGSSSGSSGSGSGGAPSAPANQGPGSGSSGPQFSWPM